MGSIDGVMVIYMARYMGVEMSWKRLGRRFELGLNILH